MQVPNYSIYGALKGSNSILIKVRTCITSKADYLFKHFAKKNTCKWFTESQFTSLVSTSEPYILSFVSGFLMFP